MKTINKIRRLAAALTIGAGAFATQFAEAAPVKNIVLVHGYFADGSRLASRVEDPHAGRL